MTVKTLVGGALALAMLSTSVAASAAPVASTANPASSLSLGKRVGTATTGKSKAAGGGAILGGLILAGVVAIGVVAIVKDDDSDSN